MESDLQENTPDSASNSGSFGVFICVCVCLCVCPREIDREGQRESMCPRDNGVIGGRGKWLIT